MLTAKEDNLIYMFEYALRTYWDMDAASDYGTPKTFTYKQLAEQITRLHMLYKRAGIKVNDRIAVMGRNNVNWISIYLATITYGAIIVPILQDFKANDALHIVNHSGSRLFFITDAIWEGLDLEQMETIETVYSLTDFHTLATVHTHHDHSFAKAEADFNKKYPNGMTPEDVHFKERSNKEVASINYTSGTTGFSKGVITPCNALAGNIHFSLTTRKVFPGCRMVAFLPLAHAYGCAIDFLSTIAAGGHVHLIGRTPAPKILLQAFAEVKPTVIMSVPLILEKIYKKMIAPQIAKAPVSWVLKVPFLDSVVLNKIRQQLMDAFGGEFAQIVIGGAPLNAEVELFLHRIRFPFAVGYGMTETAPMISYTWWEDWKLGSCGKALPGLMEIKIDHPNQDGVGEIFVKGEHLMLGYYRNEEATRAVFTKDGWLKTGDLGYLDEDGFLFIKGRNKTMLLGPSGQNIYPEEIEAKLNNMPYVMESLVIQQDEQLVALVCPDYETVDQEHLSVEGLEQAMEENRKVLNAELAAYEQISRFKLYPHEFEKTPKRSIKRFLYTQMNS